MPPFSTDDYYKLLQKIAVLETKILRLEVTMEVNGQYGNETTLPMTQISGKEQANRQMLCAKPRHKDKSPPSDMGRRLTGRTQHLETRDDTEWPALPSHRRVSSTPVPRRKQPWNVAKTKSKSKPTKDTGILLENRFAPLLQDPDSPKERSSSSTGERHLFEADGFCLNKSGVQLLSYNIFDFLRRSPAAPAKDKRRDNPKQQIRQPSGQKLLLPEIRSDQEGQDTEREVLTSSPLPQHEELPPAPTTQYEESPPAPTTQYEESPPAPTTQQKESLPAPTAQQVESPPAPPGDSQLSPTGTPSMEPLRLLASPLRGEKRSRAKLQGISEQQWAPEMWCAGPPSSGHALTPVNHCPSYGQIDPLPCGIVC
ncbi:hypothetical protein N1851_027347 [Merluccius polli]|uniref:Uncharacterized protein n=1 Tax=Merluccius polli TaxID=89951 RepID=A0AA47NSA2_MERPO|nr:hypothetical protein N1851_027347 [Merluccius polli]